MIFSKSESPQVMIDRHNPATPNLNPFHDCDFPSSSPNSVPLLTSKYCTSECDAAFLQSPRPLGRVSPLWDRGPGGHFQGWITYSVDLNRYKTRHGTVNLPVIAGERHGEGTLSGGFQLKAILLAVRIQPYLTCVHQ